MSIKVDKSLWLNEEDYLAASFVSVSLFVDGLLVLSEQSSSPGANKRNASAKRIGSSRFG
jgi:hypothetical protein